MRAKGGSTHDLVVAEGERAPAQHLVGHVHDHALDEVHLVLVVGEGLVPLEHRELGVVEPVDALVAEVLGDLVDAVQAADDEPLQVELVGDAQVHRPVERVVRRHEGPGGRAPVERLQRGRLHLEEALAVEEAAQLGDDARARAEDLAHLRVHREVGIALSVAGLGVREAGVHVRSPVSGSISTLPKGSGRSDLVSSVHASTRHRDLPRARPEDRALPRRSSRPGPARSRSAKDSSPRTSFRK